MIGLCKQLFLLEESFADMRFCIRVTDKGGTLRCLALHDTLKLAGYAPRPRCRAKVIQRFRTPLQGDLRSDLAGQGTSPRVAIQLPHCLEPVGVV